jgi:hypothetical protein
VFGVFFFPLEPYKPVKTAQLLERVKTHHIYNICRSLSRFSQLEHHRLNAGSLSNPKQVYIQYLPELKLL